MPTNWGERDLDEIIAELSRKLNRLSLSISAQQALIPFKQPFTVAATPAADYQLTYLPYRDSDSSSVQVKLNGLGLVEGTDYTVDYDTGIVTVSDDLVEDDVLTVDYWTTGELIAGSLPAEVDIDLNIPFASDGWSYHTVTNYSDIATWVTPAYDDSAWPVGATPIGLTGYTDVDGHAVASVVPPDNTGLLGHVMDLVVRRWIAPGTGITVTLDETNYVQGVYVDGTFITGSGSSTGNPRKYTVAIPDQAADWLLAVPMDVGNGYTAGGIDIEVTGTEA